MFIQVSSFGSLRNIFFIVEKKKVESDDSDEEPLSKKTKKSPPTNDEIVLIIKELLDGADLEKITMKSVCKQVMFNYD